MKTVFISRGLPGSGKSTRTRQMVVEFTGRGLTVVVASSDDFHICGCCGQYDFRLDRLAFAHSWCRAKYEKALKDGVNAVFVDNTNVSVRECRPYVEMALANGYEVRFLEPATPWAFDIDQLVVKNTHNVPRHALETMLRRWVPNMTVEKALGPVADGVPHEDEKAAARRSA